MSTIDEAAVALQHIVSHPNQGIVGVVDNVLTVCADHHLDLECQAAGSRFRSTVDKKEIAIDWPPAKSVTRAVLARVAELCNQYKANSVTPYGGSGELSLPHRPLVLFRVSFANSIECQWLKLGVVPARAPVLIPSDTPLTDVKTTAS